MSADKDFHFCETYSASVLYFTDNAVLNTVLDSLKLVSVTYDYILKTDAKNKLKNEMYLTQLSMFTEVYACYSYKRHI